MLTKIFILIIYFSFQICCLATHLHNQVVKRGDLVDASTNRLAAIFVCTGDHQTWLLMEIQINVNSSRTMQLQVSRHTINSMLDTTQLLCTGAPQMSADRHMMRCKYQQEPAATPQYQWVWCSFAESI